MASLMIGVWAEIVGDPRARWAVSCVQILTPRKKNDERFRAYFAVKIALT
jgi:hypothetical protein